jgi:Zn-dependent protease with chaperone function
MAMLGMLRLRSAEGMKLQEVKGGELCKPAFVLAKITKTPLKRVYVVPAGRGHLTNAYGAWRTIAVTDNYGKFLTSAQLDFVIGHELGDAKAKHGRKKLLITAKVIAGIALASFVMSPFLFPFRHFSMSWLCLCQFVRPISCRVVLNTLPMPLELN